MTGIFLKKVIEISEVHFCLSHLKPTSFQNTLNVIINDYLFKGDQEDCEKGIEEIDEDNTEETTEPIETFDPTETVEVPEPIDTFDIDIPDGIITEPTDAAEPVTTFEEFGPVEEPNEAINKSDKLQEEPENKTDPENMGL